MNENWNVIDSSALLAFLNKESGFEQVSEYLTNSAMSTVNVAEVAGILNKKGMPNDEAAALVSEIIEQIIPFSRQHAFYAASLLEAGRPLGLSLGDRACLSVAACQRWPVITADKVWLKIKLDIKIHCVR